MAMAALRRLAAAQHDWEWGMFFGFLGSLISSASKLMIRKSWLLLAAVAEAETDEQQGDRTSRRKLQRAAALALRWCGLLSLSVVGPVLDVLALSHATPSLLAPFSGLSLAWIVLCSEPLIGERPSPPQVLASGLVGLGLVLTTAYGDHTNPGNDGTLEDLRASYREPLFRSFLVGVVLWMALLWYGVHQTWNVGWQRLAWGVSGGSIGGLRNFLKDGLTILKIEADPRPWKLPVFWYALALGAIATAVGNLTCQTLCMKQYDATFSNAMTAGSFVLSTTVMSAIHYHTFANLSSTYDGLVYVMGMVLILVGLWVLMRPKKAVALLPDRSIRDSVAIAERERLQHAKVESYGT